MAGKNPLCMDQFFKILNACRIPGPKRDAFHVFPPTTRSAPRHICVMHNNHVRREYTWFTPSS